MKTDLSLYIHIPFCARKCRYCDFLSFDGSDLNKRDYIDRLKKEISKTAIDYRDRRVVSIFIGGGTPSILPSEYIGEIMDYLHYYFYVNPDAENTIETNPGTIDLCKLKDYYRYGINRLSIGLQSANDDELRLLGRIHTYKQFLDSFNLARQAGFKNINVDLISALPDQTLKDYEKSLETVARLKPEHISAYSLQLEEGTYLYEHREDYDWPDEDMDRELYYLTENVLDSYGYSRYEISNYSLPGYECRHNKVYWTRGDYLGLGLGASSMTGDVRFKNTSDFKAYGNAGYEDIIHLSKKDRMEEFMFLGLRLTEGISPLEFEREFGIGIDEIYGSQITELTEKGLLIRNERIKLTPLGMDVSNYVFGYFIFDDN